MPAQNNYDGGRVEIFTILDIVGLKNIKEITERLRYFLNTVKVDPKSCKGMRLYVLSDYPDGFDWGSIKNAEMEHSLSKIVWDIRQQLNPKPVPYFRDYSVADLFNLLEISVISANNALHNAIASYVESHLIERTQGDNNATASFVIPGAPVYDGFRNTLIAGYDHIADKRTVAIRVANDAMAGLGIAAPKNDINYTSQVVPLFSIDSDSEPQLNSFWRVFARMSVDLVKMAVIASSPGKVLVYRSNEVLLDIDHNLVSAERNFNSLFEGLMRRDSSLASMGVGEINPSMRIPKIAFLATNGKNPIDRESFLSLLYSDSRTAGGLMWAPNFAMVALGGEPAIIDALFAGIELGLALKDLASNNHIFSHELGGRVGLINYLRTADRLRGQSLMPKSYHSAFSGINPNTSLASSVINPRTGEDGYVAIELNSLIQFGTTLVTRVLVGHITQALSDISSVAGIGDYDLRYLLGYYQQKRADFFGNDTNTAYSRLLSVVAEYPHSDSFIQTINELANFFAPQDLPQRVMALFNSNNTRCQDRAIRMVYVANRFLALQAEDDQSLKVLVDFAEKHRGINFTAIQEGVYNQTQSDVSVAQIYPGFIDLLNMFGDKLDDLGHSYGFPLSPLVRAIAPVLFVVDPRSINLRAVFIDRIEDAAMDLLSGKRVDRVSLSNALRVGSAHSSRPIEMSGFNEREVTLSIPLGLEYFSMKKLLEFLSQHDRAAGILDAFLTIQDKADFLANMNRTSRVGFGQTNTLYRDINVIDIGGDVRLMPASLSLFTREVHSYNPLMSVSRHLPFHTNQKLPYADRLAEYGLCHRLTSDNLTANFIIYPNDFWSCNQEFFFSHVIHGFMATRPIAHTVRTRRSIAESMDLFNITDIPVHSSSFDIYGDSPAVNNVTVTYQRRPKFFILNTNQPVRFISGADLKTMLAINPRLATPYGRIDPARRLLQDPNTQASDIMLQDFFGTDHYAQPVALGSTGEGATASMVSSSSFIYDNPGNVHLYESAEDILDISRAGDGHSDAGSHARSRQPAESIGDTHSARSPSSRPESVVYDDAFSVNAIFGGRSKTAQIASSPGITPRSPLETSQKIMTKVVPDGTGMVYIMVQGVHYQIPQEKLSSLFQPIIDGKSFDSGPVDMAVKCLDQYQDVFGGTATKEVFRHINVDAQELAQSIILHGKGLRSDGKSGYYPYNNNNPEVSAENVKTLYNQFLDIYTRPEGIFAPLSHGGDLPPIVEVSIADSKRFYIETSVLEKMNSRNHISINSQGENRIPLTVPTSGQDYVFYFSEQALNYITSKAMDPVAAGLAPRDSDAVKLLREEIRQKLRIDNSQPSVERGILSSTDNQDSSSSSSVSRSDSPSNGNIYASVVSASADPGNNNVAGEAVFYYTLDPESTNVGPVMDVVLDDVSARSLAELQVAGESIANQLAEQPIYSEAIAWTKANEDANIAAWKETYSREAYWTREGQNAATQDEVRAIVGLAGADGYSEIGLIATSDAAGGPINVLKQSDNGYAEVSILATHLGTVNDAPGFHISADGNSVHLSYSSKDGPNRPVARVQGWGRDNGQNVATQASDTMRSRVTNAANNAPTLNSMYITPGYPVDTNTAISPAAILTRDTQTRNQVAQSLVDTKAQYMLVNKIDGKKINKIAVPTSSKVNVLVGGTQFVGSVMSLFGVVQMCFAFEHMSTLDKVLGVTFTTVDVAGGIVNTGVALSSRIGSNSLIISISDKLSKVGTGLAVIAYAYGMADGIRNAVNGDGVIGGIQIGVNTVSFALTATTLVFAQCAAISGPLSAAAILVSVSSQLAVAGVQLHRIKAEIPLSHDAQVRAFFALLIGYNLPAEVDMGQLRSSYNRWLSRAVALDISRSYQPKDLFLIGGFSLGGVTQEQLATNPHLYDLIRQAFEPFRGARTANCQWDFDDRVNEAKFQDSDDVLIIRGQNFRMSFDPRSIANTPISLLVDCPLKGITMSCLKLYNQGEIKYPSQIIAQATMDYRRGGARSFDHEIWSSNSTLIINKALDLFAAGVASAIGLNSKLEFSLNEGPDSSWKLATRPVLGGHSLWGPGSESMHPLCTSNADSTGGAITALEFSGLYKALMAGHLKFEQLKRKLDGVRELCPDIYVPLDMCRQLLEEYPRRRVDCWHLLDAVVQATFYSYSHDKSFNHRALEPSDDLQCSNANLGVSNPFVVDTSSQDIQFSYLASKVRTLIHDHYSDPLRRNQITSMEQARNYLKDSWQANQFSLRVRLEKFIQQELQDRTIGGCDVTSRIELGGGDDIFHTSANHHYVVQAMEGTKNFTISSQNTCNNTMSVTLADNRWIGGKITFGGSGDNGLVYRRNADSKSVSSLVILGNKVWDIGNNPGFSFKSLLDSYRVNNSLPGTFNAATFTGFKFLNFVQNAANSPIMMVIKATSNMTLVASVDSPASSLKSVAIIGEQNVSNSSVQLMLNRKIEVHLTGYMPNHFYIQPVFGSPAPNIINMTHALSSGPGVNDNFCAIIIDATAECGDSAINCLVRTVDYKDSVLFSLHVQGVIRGSIIISEYYSPSHTLCSITIRMGEKDTQINTMNNFISRAIDQCLVGDCALSPSDFDRISSMHASRDDFLDTIKSAIDAIKNSTSDIQDFNKSILKLCDNLGIEPKELGYEHLRRRDKRSDTSQHNDECRILRGIYGEAAQCEVKSVVLVTSSPVSQAEIRTSWTPKANALADLIREGQDIQSEQALCLPPEGNYNECSIILNGAPNAIFAANPTNTSLGYSYYVFYPVGNNPKISLSAGSYVVVPSTIQGDLSINFDGFGIDTTIENSYFTNGVELCVRDLTQNTVLSTIRLEHFKSGRIDIMHPATGQPQYRDASYYRFSPDPSRNSISLTTLGSSLNLPALIRGIMSSRNDMNQIVRDSVPAAVICSYIGNADYNIFQDGVDIVVQGPAVGLDSSDPNAGKNTTCRINGLCTRSDNIQKTFLIRHYPDYEMLIGVRVKPGQYRYHSIFELCDTQRYYPCASKWEEPCDERYPQWQDRTVNINAPMIIKSLTCGTGVVWPPENTQVASNFVIDVDSAFNSTDMCWSFNYNPASKVLTTLVHSNSSAEKTKTTIHRLPPSMTLSFDDYRGCNGYVAWLPERGYASESKWLIYKSNADDPRGHYSALLMNDHDRSALDTAILFANFFGINNSTSANISSEQSAFGVCAPNSIPHRINISSVNVENTSSVNAKNISYVNVENEKIVDQIAKEVKNDFENILKEAGVPDRHVSSGASKTLFAGLPMMAGSMLALMASHQTSSAVFWGVSVNMVAYQLAQVYDPVGHALRVVSGISDTATDLISRHGMIDGLNRMIRSNRVMPFYPQGNGQNVALPSYHYDAAHKYDGVTAHIMKETCLELFTEKTMKGFNGQAYIRVDTHTHAADAELCPSQPLEGIWDNPGLSNLYYAQYAQQMPEYMDLYTAFQKSIVHTGLSNLCSQIGARAMEHQCPGSLGHTITVVYNATDPSSANQPTHNVQIAIPQMVYVPTPMQLDLDGLLTFTRYSIALYRNIADRRGSHEKIISAITQGRSSTIINSSAFGEILAEKTEKFASSTMADLPESLDVEENEVTGWFDCIESDIKARACGADGQSLGSNAPQTFDYLKAISDELAELQGELSSNEVSSDSPEDSAIEAYLLKRSVSFLEGLLEDQEGLALEVLQVVGKNLQHINDAMPDDYDLPSCTVSHYCADLRANFPKTLVDEIVAEYVDLSASSVSEMAKYYNPMENRDNTSDSLPKIQPVIISPINAIFDKICAVSSSQDLANALVDQSTALSVDLSNLNIVRFHDRLIDAIVRPYGIEHKWDYDGLLANALHGFSHCIDDLSLACATPKLRGLSSASNVLAHGIEIASDAMVGVFDHTVRSVSRLLVPSILSSIDWQPSRRTFASRDEQIETILEKMTQASAHESILAIVTCSDFATNKIIAGQIIMSSGVGSLSLCPSAFTIYDLVKSRSIDDFNQDRDLELRCGLLVCFASDVSPKWLIKKYFIHNEASELNDTLAAVERIWQQSESSRGIVDPNCTKTTTIELAELSKMDINIDLPEMLSSKIEDLCKDNLLHKSDTVPEQHLVSSLNKFSNSVRTAILCNNKLSIIERAQHACAETEEALSTWSEAMIPHCKSALSNALKDYNGQAKGLNYVERIYYNNGFDVENFMQFVNSVAPGIDTQKLTEIAVFLSNAASEILSGIYAIIDSESLMKNICYGHDVPYDSCFDLFAQYLLTSACSAIVDGFVRDVGQAISLREDNNPIQPRLDHVSVSSTSRLGCAIM